MTVVDFFRMLKANIVILLLGVLLAAAAGYGYSMLQPKVYTSKSTGFVVVNDSADGSVISGSRLAQERANAYLPLINSRAVQEQISQMNDGNAPADSLSAEVAIGSNVIVVSASASDPEAAAKLANTALLATAEVANRIEGSQSAVRVEALEDAVVPTAPSSPNIPLNVASGAAIGLALALAVAFLRRLFDVNIRTTTDARVAAGAGILGALPSDETFSLTGDGVDHLAPRASEAVRQLRTNLKFVSVDNPPKTISITSADPEEGKSTVISALATALAAAGDRVILVDADLRRPRQAALFNIEGRVGLSEVLAGQVELDDAIQEVGPYGLLILPAGRTPPNPSELLGSERMRLLLEELSRHCTVLIDAPPVLPVTDSTLLSTSVDGTVLVVRHGKTRREHVEVARDMLANVNATVLGVVLNRVPAKGVGSSYYGSGYGASDQSYAPYQSAPRKTRGSNKRSRRRSRKTARHRN